MVSTHHKEGPVIAGGTVPCGAMWGCGVVLGVCSWAVLCHLLWGGVCRLPVAVRRPRKLCQCESTVGPTGGPGGVCPNGGSGAGSDRDLTGAGDGA